MGPVGGGRRTLLVMAKAPVPGQVKTRLCPPLSYKQAAEVAEAALMDTLAAVQACSVDRRVVALEGRRGPWLPEGLEAIAQQGESFADRLSHAWSRVEGPTVQIGMDTPQVTAAMLAGAFDHLESSDAVLGMTLDGGWWALGLNRPQPGVFDGVPMSSADTGQRQFERLADLGLSVGLLDPSRDIDTYADLVAVAGEITRSRTAAVFSRLVVPQ